jgi:hypothetical protein
MANLDDLGYARVFRDPETGELVVDTDSLRRPAIAGDFEGDDELGDRSDRRRRRLERRLDRTDRREGRLERREDRLRDKLHDLDDDDDGSSRKKGGVKWGMTMVGGIDTLTGAGTATVRVRLQHHFKATDITFEGTTTGTAAKVTSIFFGDRPVWSNPDGVSVEAFAPGSMMRGILRGQNLREGLDIIVNGTLGGAGDFAATIMGMKPVSTC